jgi:3-hydroxyisobutyrate dehydrogenase/2-hydroxy-3-oxopropionate reductase
VTEGADGVAAGVSRRSALIQMSTVGMPALERLQRLLPESSVLDAPVLGSVGEAEEGTLKVFAGGPAELVGHWTPLLSTLGTVVPVGPVGAGTARLMRQRSLVDFGVAEIPRRRS